MPNFYHKGEEANYQRLNEKPFTSNQIDEEMDSFDKLNLSNDNNILDFNL